MLSNRECNTSTSTFKVHQPVSLLKDLGLGLTNWPLSAHPCIFMHFVNDLWPMTSVFIVK
jgi:hypothetical protein